MRRNEFMITDTEQLHALCKQQGWGTLAFSDNEGIPRAVPVNHVWIQDQFVFHGSPGGQKARAFLQDPNCGAVLASYSIVEELSYIPAFWDAEAQDCTCTATQFFRAIEALGRIHVVVDLDEKKQLLLAFVQHQQKLNHVQDTRLPSLDTRELMHCAVWVMRPQRMSGKFKLGQNLDEHVLKRLRIFLHQRNSELDRKTLALMRPKDVP
jgi:nitroimidazol reductase NimA-like FMN-containing flavoprotein (pyridoxamine 5'-phosphate oxidase superfamily)